MSILRSGSNLLRAGGGSSLLKYGGDSSDLEFITASNFELIGQQKTSEINYNNMAIAFRYVGSERRFLAYQYSTAFWDGIGDLIEFKVNASGIKNGSVHWDSTNCPELTEVRRWKNWHTRQRMVDAGLTYNWNIFIGWNDQTLREVSTVGNFIMVDDRDRPGNSDALNYIVTSANATTSGSGRGLNITGSGGNDGNFTIASASIVGSLVRIVLNEPLNISAPYSADRGVNFARVHAGGNGCWPSSFYWDEESDLLWYSWQPSYPGGWITWPAYNCTYLDDDEAVVVGDGSTTGRTVSGSNVGGPYYFKDAADGSPWKAAAAGIIPIPASRQSEMGGNKYIFVGHHCANVGNDGARGTSFWTVDDLPSTMPAEGSTLWTGATHIYDTSPDSGVVEYGMRIPNVQYAGSHTSQGATIWRQFAGAAVIAVSDFSGTSTGNTVDDAFYQHDYGYIDCISVYMNAGATGGSWVPEFYNGTAWVQPTGWAMAIGDAQLSQPKNVFYWTRDTSLNQSTVPWPGIDAGAWVRIRRTAAGSSAGTFHTILCNAAIYNDAEAGARGLTVGGNAAYGSELFDEDHYAKCYEEIFWGGAWIKTDTVEGIAYFGPIHTDATWYGASPTYMQPQMGGVPVERFNAPTLDSLGNGGKSGGPWAPYLFTFDHNEIIECQVGTRARNTEGLLPKVFYRIAHEFTDLIKNKVVPNPSSPYYLEDTYAPYGTGHSVMYDPATQQVIVWLTNGTTTPGNNILAFFQVS